MTSSVYIELGKVKTELHSTKKDLSDTVNELRLTKIELSSLRIEFTQLKDDVRRLQILGTQQSTRLNSEDNNILGDANVVDQDMIDKIQTASAQIQNKNTVSRPDLLSRIGDAVVRLRNTNAVNSNEANIKIGDGEASSRNAADSGNEALSFEGVLLTDDQQDSVMQSINMSSSKIDNIGSTIDDMSKISTIDDMNLSEKKNTEDIMTENTARINKKNPFDENKTFVCSTNESSQINNSNNNSSSDSNAENDIGNNFENISKENMMIAEEKQNELNNMMNNMIREEELNNMMYKELNELNNMIREGELDHRSTHELDHITSRIVSSRNDQSEDSGSKNQKMNVLNRLVNGVPVPLMLRPENKRGGKDSVVSNIGTMNSTIRLQQSGSTNKIKNSLITKAFSSVKPSGSALKVSVSGGIKSVRKDLVGVRKDLGKSLFTVGCRTNAGNGSSSNPSNSGLVIKPIINKPIINNSSGGNTQENQRITQETQRVTIAGGKVTNAINSTTNVTNNGTNTTNSRSGDIIRATTNYTNLLRTNGNANPHVTQRAVTPRDTVQNGANPHVTSVTSGLGHLRQGDYRKENLIQNSQQRRPSPNRMVQLHSQQTIRANNPTINNPIESSTRNRFI